MTDLMTADVLTMSSLEISKLVESRHDNVRVSIETLAERGVIKLPELQEVSSPDPGPKTIRVYNLEKRDSFIVVAQLSPEFTARLVDRWQELEGDIAKLTPAEQLLRSVQLTVEHEKKLKALSANQKETADKVATVSRRLDQIETANDQFTIVGWFSLNKSGNLPLTQSAAMGAQATKFCKDNGIDMGKVPDPRFGKVNTYPKWILDDMFGYL